MAENGLDKQSIEIFGKIPTPIIMAATGHKSESSFLKYIWKSRAEMASMLAGYWYGKQTRKNLLNQQLSVKRESYMLD
jgi:hypothetical protein